MTMEQGVLMGKKSNEVEMCDTVCSHCLDDRLEEARGGRLGADRLDHTRERGN